MPRKMFKLLSVVGIAALLLAQMGFKPIVLERGRDVRRRTRDTWALWRKHTLLPESNVQFGEGGAGTFSDGKLYSQVKDPRFLGRKVLADVPLADIVPYIDWSPFFQTWELGGKYPRIFEDSVVGSEARKLFDDAQALLQSAAQQRIQLGQKLTRGLGAGGNPVIGQKAAEESRNELQQSLEGADLVFIAAGEGDRVMPGELEAPERQQGHEVAQQPAHGDEHQQRPEGHHEQATGGRRLRLQPGHDDGTAADKRDEC